MRTKVAVLMLVVFLTPAMLYADNIPQMINYQGRLLANDGTPINDSGKVIRFRMYNDPALGSTEDPCGQPGGACIWEEERTVSVKEGFFSVLLGETNPLTGAVFSGGQRYLGMKILGEADEIMPRPLIVSAPYAMNGASVGDIKTSIADSLPGWIRCAGKSIGSLGSGADHEGYAYRDLYDLIWSLPGLSVSSGSPFVLSAAQGSTAQEDWDAGKTITIDFRARYAIGGGPSDSVGAQVGSNDGHQHLDIQVTGGAHTHPVSDPGHNHGIPLTVWLPVAGAGTGWVWTNDGLSSHITSSSGTGISIGQEGGTPKGHTHTTGRVGKATGPNGDADGSNKPLSVVVNYFIKY